VLRLGRRSVKLKTSSGKASIWSAPKPGTRVGNAHMELEAYESEVSRGSTATGRSLSILMTNMSAVQCSTHGLVENRQQPQSDARSIPGWQYYWRLLEGLSVPKSALRVSPFCPERFVQRVCCLLQVHPFSPPHQSRAASHPSERTEPSQKGRAKVVSACASRGWHTGQCRMEAASLSQCDFSVLRRLPKKFWSASRLRALQHRSKSLR
jgi:hypothetical protein